MKSDFHTDDDAANTPPGAEAMTSATGVELDMPIKPVRDHGDHHAMSVRALPKRRNRRPETGGARLSVAASGTRTCGVPCTASRRPAEPTPPSLGPRLGRRVTWPKVQSDGVPMMHCGRTHCYRLCSRQIGEHRDERITYTRFHALFLGWWQDTKLIKTCFSELGRTQYVCPNPRDSA